MLPKHHDKTSRGTNDLVQYDKHMLFLRLTYNSRSK